MKTQTLNNNSVATHPGGIHLSHAKLKEFHPELYRFMGISRFMEMLSPVTKKLAAKQQYLITRTEESLLYGDSRAALVISIQPLLVAAYTDELDCSAVLSFPASLVATYSLEVGSRLLTVNTYAYGEVPVPDLVYGPAAYRRYSNFFPLIAEFLTDDYDASAKRKAEIEQAEWHRTIESAQEYIVRNNNMYRSGLPLHSGTPAS